MSKTNQSVRAIPAYAHTLPDGSKVSIAADPKTGQARHQGEVVATYVRAVGRWFPAKGSSAKTGAQGKPAVSILGHGVVNLMDETGRGPLLGVYTRQKPGEAPEVVMQRVYVDPTGEYAKTNGKQGEKNPTIQFGGETFGLAPGATTFRSREQVAEAIAALQRQMGNLPAPAAAPAQTA